MRKIDANRWIEIIANLGIVAGLLLVAAQMKQTADLQRLRMLHEESRGMVELERSLLGENAAAVWAKSIESPRDLSLGERRIMDAYFYSFAEQLHASFLLEQEGLLEEGEWLTRVQLDSRYFFGNPYGLAWWRAYSGIESLPQELKDSIDKELSNNTRFTLLAINGPLKDLDEILDSESATKQE